MLCRTRPHSPCGVHAPAMASDGVLVRRGFAACPCAGALDTGILGQARRSPGRRPAAGRQMRPRPSLRPPTAAARQGTRRRLAIVPGRRLPRRLARALSAGRRAPPRGLVPAGFPCSWDWGGCRLGGTGAPWEARGAPMPQYLPICASRAHACPCAPAGGRLEGQCI